MDKPKLTDLIDVAVLQKIQDGFSAFTGMAALITDEFGIPVTNGSNFSDFCMKYTRESELGRTNCEECDKQGALVTLKEGRPVIYRCHAGLCDYAVPILLEGRFIGSFIGGQISTSPLDMDKIRRTAIELGIDEEEYVEAAGRILEKPKEEVSHAADFLYILGSVLSDMAYKSSEELKNSRKLERAAQSQATFIMDLNDDFKNNMNSWIEDAKAAVASGNSQIMEKTIKQLLIKGPELLSDFSDTVEYAKMTDGKLELNETEYNMDNLLRFVCRNVEASLEDNEIVIIRQIDDDVPAILLGDEGRIGQVISKLLMTAAQYTNSGVIDLHVSGKKSGYAENIEVIISDDSFDMTPEELKSVKQYLKHGNRVIIERQDFVNMDFSMVSFIAKQMSGNISIESAEGNGTSFIFSLPQLEV